MAQTFRSFSTPTAEGIHYAVWALKRLREVMRFRMQVAVEQLRRPLPVALTPHHGPGVPFQTSPVWSNVQRLSPDYRWSNVQRLYPDYRPSVWSDIYSRMNIAAIHARASTTFNVPDCRPAATMVRWHRLVRLASPTPSVQAVRYCVGNSDMAQGWDDALAAITTAH